jgi:hypothetical protein
MAHLKWPLRPMGMVKSIAFLTFFPNTNSNNDILFVECIVKL